VWINEAARWSVFCSFLGDFVKQFATV
jgi:hypothetical protein